MTDPHARTLSVPYAAVAVVVVALLAALVGYRVGVGKREAVQDVGVAHSVARQISIETGEWTYNVPLDVSWKGGDGSWREGGRPECLPASDEAIPDVRFAWVPVALGGSHSRQVVAVYCT